MGVPLTHDDLVGLIRGAVDPGGTWAELGSGRGAFTAALAALVGPSGRVISIDRDGSALALQRRALAGRFPGLRLEYRQADFLRPLGLSGLDGVLMANSLHFTRAKEHALRLVGETLGPRGRLVLVEYQADRGNPWVPHPLSFPTFQRLAVSCGFTDVRLLATVPSRHLGEIYSAVAEVL